VRSLLRRSLILPMCCGPCLAKIYVGLENTDLNFTIEADLPIMSRSAFHWCISVIPRLTRVVGFEFGSRMLINTVLPERPRNSFEM
jgi:hypothetical protein